MSKKVYSDGGEIAYDIDYWKEYTEDHQITVRVELEKPDIGGEMWCQVDQEFVEKGTCGDWCRHYDPCNGKSGRCRNLKHGLIGTGIFYDVQKDGKVLRVKKSPHDR